MTKKCLGCGADFQTENPNKEGYVKEENFDKSVICQRCFKIKNYGEYQIIDKSNHDYQNIFEKVKKANGLILFLCDIFTLDQTIKRVNEFKQKVILVITKKDLLPKSVKEQKIRNYILKNYELNILDIVFVNANKNYNLDLLMSKIEKFKESNDVYLVGNTNAGKSTLINALIKSYSGSDPYITTSILPATTLDIIKIKLNSKITLIDTPGLVNNDNYLSLCKPSDIKIISPKVEIKPRTYQIKPNQSLIIGDYARIDYLGELKNSFTLYVSNNIKVKRINLNTNNNLRNLCKTSLDLENNMDVVINGLCFCKIVGSAKVDVYVKKEVAVSKRPNLI